jgi:Rrf2 family protein
MVIITTKLVDILVGMRPDREVRMRLSKKADYALRVLFTLVDEFGRGPQSLTHLARRNEVPRKFLEHIMLDLKQQGWVASSAGRHGGYVLSLPPEQITMGQVVRLFDGLMAPIACVSVDRHEGCSQAPKCRFRRVLLEVRNRTAQYLDSMTLANVAGHEPVRDHEVFSLHLVAGDGI